MSIATALSYLQEAAGQPFLLESVKVERFFKEIAARSGKAFKLKNTGVSSYALSGASEEVISKMELSVADIASAVKELLKK